MSNVAAFISEAGVPAAGKPGRKLPAVSLDHVMYAAAGLLFIVSAMTAFYGASVLRPDQKTVAILTAAGSALALAAIEKRLLANIVAPTASSLRLLICAAPFFALCTFFSAATFFDVHRREISAQADRDEVWARWQKERPRFAGFQTATIVALRAARTREQAELAAPVGEGVSPADASAARRLHRGRIAALTQVEKMAADMPALPLTPADVKTADAALAEGYGWAQRVSLNVPPEIMSTLTLPVPDTRTPRADDVVSILIRETSMKTPTARFAWGAALFVECLPFLCLLAATPGVAVATRLRRGRARLASIGPALSSPLGQMIVPFQVRDLGLAGTVTLHGDVGRLSVTDFLASLDAFYPTFERKTGRPVREVEILDDEGEPLASSIPLAEALVRGPLLLRLI